MDRPSLLSLPFQASSKEAAGFFQASSNEKAGCFQASSKETGCLFSVSSDETEGCFQAESSEMGAKVAAVFSAAGWVGRGSNRAGFVFSSGEKKRLTWWFQESSPHPHLQITWTHSQSPHIRIMHTSWQLFWELPASWLSAHREKNWETPHLLQWWKVNDSGHVLSDKQTDLLTSRPTSRHAKQRDKHLAVAGRWGGGGTVDRLNKRTNTLMWWCGDVNKQTCGTKKPMGWGMGGGNCQPADMLNRGQYLVGCWGGGGGGCQPADMLNKEANTLLWWGGGEGAVN